MTVAAEPLGNPALTMTVFGAFVAITLLVVHRVSRRDPSTPDHDAAGHALTGDYLSAASFLGIAGAVAVHGHDGFLYSIGFLVAWLVALLLVAELVRNTGRSTMGDVLADRMRERPVRAAAATSTLVVSFFYLLAQMAGAGGLVALLLGVYGGGEALVISVVGLIMIGYVLVGGMQGSARVQIVKASALVLCVVLMAVFLLGKFGFGISTLLDEAAAHHAHGRDLLEPGVRFGTSATSRLDFVSLSLALVLGAAGLPHVLTRFRTVPNAVQAHRSVVWAIGSMAVFYLATLVVGYGASALVGSDTILASTGGENSAAPLLAFEIGGTLLLGVVAAVAFAAILAVVAGLTMTASTSFARDVYACVARRGKTEPAVEVRVARRTSVVVGLLAMVGGVLANGQNVAFLVALAFAFAASANLSTLLYSLFWRRFNTRGTLWGMYAGLGSCLLLVAVSPVVSGSPTSIFPGIDFQLFPLANPGIVAIPVSFLAGFLGTVLSTEKPDPARQAELEVRTLTGIGS